MPPPRCSSAPPRRDRLPARQDEPVRRTGGASRCRSSPSRSASPAAGPSTMATATARFSRTTGLPVSDSSRCVGPRDLGPPGGTVRRRLVVQRRDRGRAAGTHRCGRPRGRVQQLQALRDQGAVPRRPVLLGQRDQGPVGRRTGRSPRLGQQHQREQPRDLGVTRRLRWSIRVSRIASPDRSTRDSSGPLERRVALVEQQLENLAHRPQPPPRHPPGRRTRDPAAWPWPG